MIAFAAAIALTAALMTGCRSGSDAPPTPSASLSQSRSEAPSEMPSEAPTQAAVVLQYTCGRFPFGADVLDAAGMDETAANPVAVALRAHLAKGGPDIDFLPDHGWTLAGMDLSGAEFVTTAGDAGMKVVELDSQPTWHVTGWGDCHARRVLAPGLGDADWVFDPVQPKPGPDTQTFVALVTERECASGQSSEGRVVGPDIMDAGDRLLVTFAVRPLGGDLQECPGNPPTRVKVDLGEPLGSRILLDGGSLPPRDPASEP